MVILVWQASSCFRLTSPSGSGLVMRPLVRHPLSWWILRGPRSGSRDRFRGSVIECLLRSLVVTTVEVVPVPV